MGSATVHITDENFENEVLKSNQVVFVDFWATWCGPCRAIAPLVEQLATDFAGKAKVAKLDVDEAGNAASRYGVMSIPTLMVFKGGEPVETLVGRTSKEEMARMIERHM